MSYRPTALPAVLYAILVTTQALGAAGGFSQGFHYQGRLLKNDGFAPRTGQADLTLGIYSSNGNCLLYEEKQSVNLDETEGFFSVVVGSASGDPKRTARDPGKTLVAIFTNGSPLREDHSTCPEGYTPGAGEARRLRVTFQIDGGVAETLNPDLVISPTPQTYVAETLQGLTPDAFIRAKDSVTQAALETLTAGASSDASALHNHDGQYAKLSGSSSISLGAGQVLGLGSNSGTPADVREGDTWFDATDKKVKYWDGTQAVAVGSAAGPSGVSSFNSRTGAVTLTDADLTAALGFTPANASTMTTALAGKEPLLAAGTDSQFYRGDKTWQTLDTDAVAEGTNRYFTEARARAALSSAGPIDYNFTTGQVSMLNKGSATTVLHGNASGQPAFSAIVENDLSLSDVATGDSSTAKHGFLPKLPGGTTTFLRGDGSWATPVAGAVSSIAGRTGDVTLSTADISGLGAAATSAVGNLTESTSSVLTISGGTGAVLGSGASIQVKQASATTSGYLSATDWAAFNAKESALTAGTASQYLKGDKTWGTFSTDVRSEISATLPIVFSGGTISMANQGSVNTVLHGNAAGNPAFSAIVEGDLSLSDTTTGNASTTKHGFLPKLPGGTTNFLREDGTWAAPAASADLTTAVNFGTAAAGTVTMGKTGQNTVLNGKVGVGATPTVALDVAGAIRPGSSASVTTCGSGQANGEGSLRYNYTSHAMEYCNGTSWIAMGVYQ